MAAQQNAGRNADQQGQRHGRCHQLQMLAGVVQQITPILIDDICTYPLNQAGTSNTEMAPPIMTLRNERVMITPLSTHRETMPRRHSRLNFYGPLVP